MGSKIVKWPVKTRTGPSKKKSLIFMVLLLVPVVVTSLGTYRSTLVETELVENSLYRQAELVTKGIAASLNVGMMHSAWTREILQDLLNANARESDARLIFLSSPEGVIAASSGPLRLRDLPEKFFIPSHQESIPEKGIFLKEPDLYVFRRTIAEERPNAKGDALDMGGMMGMHNTLATLPDNLSITVVLDAAGTSYLKAHHLRMNLVTAIFLTISIAGIAGWGFWSQRARETAVALARTESYAGEIITRMPAGLLLCDAKGSIAITNPGAAQILGLDEEHLRGKAVREIFPEQLLSCETLQSGREHPVTEGTMVVEGRKLAINLSATPIPGEGDDPGGFLILFQDISELETLREKLARAERLAEIGKLSATVAHEIRNPLSSIRGLAQLLSGKVSSQQSPLMETIVKEVDRLNRVVSGLLSYARHENLRIGQWKIENILEHVKVLAEGDARLKDIRMEVEVTPPDMSWDLDRDMTIQALLNLTMNAIEASPAGKMVLLSAAVKDNTIVLNITDEGAGVPEDSDRLFTLFESTKVRGTGLGLPLVRKVAQLHGGGASISRGPVKGSIASIWIPHRGGA